MGSTERNGRSIRREIASRLREAQQKMESLKDIKDPNLVYLEMRTNEDDPYCSRIITTGNSSSCAYTEKIVDAILCYRREFGEFPSLSQLLLAISRNLDLVEKGIGERRVVLLG